MINTISTLLNEVNEIRTKHEADDLKSGVKFNLFSILNVTTDEVRLHSNFIAELLNPKGSHGQGAVFLKLFTKLLEIEQFSEENAIVEVEKHIGTKTDTTGGRLDIYISDGFNSLTIENKIYAGDQENQLIRYHNYKSENLFYLNLLGDEPSSKSIGELKLNNDFTIISYKDHIIPWLQKCVEKVDAIPLIHEGINHYINLLKQLTRQNTNSKMTQEIKNLLKKDSNHIKNIHAINNAFTEIKINTQWCFWEELIEEFQKKFNQKFEGTKTITLQKVTNYYTKKDDTYAKKAFTLELKEINKLKIYFVFEIYHNFYYGFITDTITKDNQRTYHEIQKIATANNSFETDQEWLAWKYTTPKLNFKNFESDAILELIDSEKRKKRVEEIVTIAIDDITTFCETIEEESKSTLTT